MGTFIQAHVLPESGGDTCFSCMYSAYQALSRPLQEMLDGLTAQHSRAELLAATQGRGQYDSATASETAPISHPIVTVNRTTGRKRLFVNSLYTKRVDSMSQAESDYLLAFLFDHIQSPQFQLRIAWQVGDLAFWDNHACQHYAVPDYNERRRLQRVTLTGYRPQGFAGTQPLHKEA
jgi:taurine dioxygenase